MYEKIIDDKTLNEIRIIRIKNIIFKFKKLIE